MARSRRIAVRIAWLAGLAAGGRAAAGAPDTVVVAARDLQAGMPILEEEVERLDLGPVALPFEPVRSLSGAIGSVPQETVYAGEVIRRERLSMPNLVFPTAYENLVPEGRRAFEIPAGAEPGELAGGDRVDVIWRSSDGTAGPCRLVQAASVLALREETGLLQLQKPSRTWRAAVLLVSPAEILSIETARLVGDLAVRVRLAGADAVVDEQGCPDPLPGVGP